MIAKGQNIEDVKIINRAFAIQLLLANGPMARSDIAAELGITPATITSICNEFFQKNLLVQRQKCDTPGKVG
ncbi:MAG: transcriptional regulator, partial [Planctomycetota bacterium]|nr:transcriptional regulator [Planctomycetota bacterium]